MYRPFFVTFLLILFPAFFFSAPVGNPYLPSILEEGLFIPDTFWSNIQLGFTEDFLLQKKMKQSKESQIGSIRKARIQGIAQIGDISWTIREQFDLTAELGTGQISWSWTQPGLRLSGESDMGFFWGCSAKLVFFEIKDTAFSAFGQAGGADDLKSWVCFNGNPGSVKTKLKLRYWQAGGAVTQRIGFFSPYFGCLANQTFFKVSRLPDGAARLEPRMIVGPILGCTLSTGSTFSLNMEWRGWFEEGLSISGQVRF